MREKKARIIRILFLIIFAPIMFPVAGLLVGYEMIIEFLDNLKLCEKWMGLWEWIADHILP
jgi:hypothetical protein